MSTIVDRHIKQRAFLRGWLVGQGMFKAIAALEMMESYSTGLRKDGVTPESNHPLSVAQFLVTLHTSLIHVEDTITVALLHDICEDYDIDFDIIEAKFGRQVRDAVHALTKVYRGVKRAPAEVAQAQAENPIASVVKGSDRVHNQSTSVGVFGPAKMRDYVAETRRDILPMLRKARKRFPEQYGVYLNIQLTLESQNEFMLALAEQADS